MLVVRLCGLPGAPCVVLQRPGKPSTKRCSHLPSRPRSLLSSLTLVQQPSPPSVPPLPQSTVSRALGACPCRVACKRAPSATWPRKKGIPRVYHWGEKKPGLGLDPPTLHKPRGPRPSFLESSALGHGLSDAAQARRSRSGGGAAPRSPARSFFSYWVVFARNLLSGSDGASLKVGRPLALFACWVSTNRWDNICPFIGLGSKRFAEVPRASPLSSFQPLREGRACHSHAFEY